MSRNKRGNHHKAKINSKGEGTKKGNAKYNITYANFNENEEMRHKSLSKSRIGNKQANPGFNGSFPEENEGEPSLLPYIHNKTKGNFDYKPTASSNFYTKVPNASSVFNQVKFVLDSMPLGPTTKVEKKGKMAREQMAHHTTTKRQEEPIMGPT